MENTGLGNLFTKLAKISGELGAIPKDAKHQQNYMYQSADNVMAHLNPLLSAHNIVIIPMATKTRLETPADGISRYVIDYEFVICDGDTGETFVAAWQGDIPTGYAGNKVDDKAMGKAHTYALKYWLLKLFKVTSQDDVDLDGNNHTYSNQPPAKTSKPVPAQTSTPASGNAATRQRGNGDGTPVIMWSQDEQKSFWNIWNRDKKIAKGVILGVLGVKSLGEFKNSLDRANVLMDMETRPQASGQ